MDTATLTAASAAHVGNLSSSSSSSSSSNSNSIISGNQRSNSSSSSSGYGSATTTPTTPIGNLNYEASVAATATSAASISVSATASTSAVAINSSPIPVATVAAVTPYYNESLTAFEAQQRQQYYQTYGYPMTGGIGTGTGSLGVGSSVLRQAQQQQYANNLYESYVGSTYQQYAAPSVERNIIRHTPSELTHLTAKQSSTALSASSNSGSSTNLNRESNVATTKPQATATPFYAQPPATAVAASGYFDAYKYAKMPTKLPPNAVATADYSNYSNHLPNVAAVTYQQQQYYAAAKSQLQDANYAASVKPSYSRQPMNSYYGNCGGNSSGSSAAYYDKYEKYMFAGAPPTAAAAAASATINATYPPPQHATSPHFSPETVAPSTDAYRKATSSWHWSMDYATGGCRTLPPPPHASASCLPTATVPPTNAAYLTPHGATATTRDAFYAHDKYAKYDKYDKYNAYYHHHPQQYMQQAPQTPPPPPANARNVWPSSHAHTQLTAPLNERLQHTHTSSLHAAHASAHHFSATGTAAPQSCCVQPYQQQSCYYQRAPPPPTHHLSAATTAYGSTHPAQQVHYNNSNNKYVGGSSISEAYTSPHGSKLKNSNDLYVTASPFDSPTAHLNFTYPPTAATSQRYATSTHGVVDASNGYYNDLNLHANYESYANNLPQASQHIGVTQRAPPYHNITPNITGISSAAASTSSSSSSASTPSDYQAHLNKSPLIDYRKPIATSTPLQHSNYYRMQQSPLTNLANHVADVTSYGSYNMACNGTNTTELYDGTTTSAELDAENTEKSAATKNLSIRDFLATWNEDEEDYGASAVAAAAAAAAVVASVTEDLNFLQTESQPTEVSRVENMNLSYGHENAHQHIYKTITSEHQQQQVQHAQHSQQQQNQMQQQNHENHLQMKNSFNARPKVQVGITVDSAVDVETNQYINLPDIIIDIEKSNTNVNPESKELTFGNFDVEKELDELQIKKAKLSSDKCVFTQEDNLLETHTEPAPQLLHQQQESNMTETIKDMLIKPGHEAQEREHDRLQENVANTFTTAVQINEEEDFQNVVEHDEHTFDNPEHYLKDIEYDNNSHSNESTFEKEYETFINKIGSETVALENVLQNEITTIATLSESQSQSQEQKDDLSLAKQNNSPVQSTEDSAENSSELKSETNSLMAADANSAADADRELTQNIENFSKFYKKKRRLMEKQKEENNNTAKQAKLEHIDTTTATTSLKQNFPKAYTKKCRKRKALQLKEKTQMLQANMRHIKYVRKSNTLNCKNRKPLSLYYKTLHSLRRFRFGRFKLNTTFLVQQHIAMLKERHLPLIKRQSIKKYSTNSQIYYNPKTLKCLSVCVVNTEAFRQSILKEVESDYETENKTEGDQKNSTESNSVIDSGDFARLLKDKTSSQLTENDNDNTAANENFLENFVKVEKQTIIADNYNESINQYINSGIGGNNHGVNKLEQTVTAFSNDNGTLNTNKQDSPLDSTSYDNTILMKNYAQIEKDHLNNADMLETSFEANDDNSSRSDQYTDYTNALKGDTAQDKNDSKSNTSEIINFTNIFNIDNALQSREDVEPTECCIESNENRNFNFDDSQKHTKEASSKLENMQSVPSVNKSERNNYEESNHQIKESIEETFTSGSNFVNKSSVFEESGAGNKNENEIITKQSNDCMDSSGCSDNDTEDIKCQTLNSEIVKNECENNIKDNKIIDNEFIDCKMNKDLSAGNEESEGSDSENINCKATKDESAVNINNNTEEDDKRKENNSGIIGISDASQEEEDEKQLITEKIICEEFNAEINIDTTEKYFPNEQTTAVAGENNETHHKNFSCNDIKLEHNDLQEKSPKSPSNIFEEIETELEKVTNPVALVELKITENINILGNNNIRASSKQNQNLGLIDENSNSSIASSSSTSSSSTSTDSLTSDPTDGNSSDSSSTSTATSISDDEHDNIIGVHAGTEAKAELEKKFTVNDAASISSDGSDFNELAALERELSQHHSLSKEFNNTQEKQTESGAFAKMSDMNMAVSTATDNIAANISKITKSDIANLKKILESDNEENDDKHIQEEQNDADNNIMMITAAVQCDEAINLQAVDSNEQHESNENKTNERVSEENIVEMDVETVVAVAVAEFETDINAVGDASADGSGAAIPTLKSLAQAVLNISAPLQYAQENDAETKEKIPFIVPKLSDLCKVALNSSFKTFNTLTTSTTITTLEPTTATAVISERELSVEEALAEMYRQAGVTSDPEDYDAEENKEEAQDVLLINLEEILDSDSDVYVLQCDMNENILGVVAHAATVDDGETNDNSNNDEDNNNNTMSLQMPHAVRTAELADIDNTERVNTLQLVEILNASDFNRNTNNTVENSDDNNDNAIVTNQLQILNANDNLIILTTNAQEVAITTLTTSLSATTSTPSLSTATVAAAATTLFKDHNISDNTDLTDDNVTADATSTASAADDVVICCDSTDEDSLTSQFDLPSVHHEEIVPDNYIQFEKEQFRKYLHEKYVQKTISKFYHANRILKKYKKNI